jgi:hypothetical protein
MLAVYRKKLIIGLLTLNLIFFVIFMLAFFNTVQGRPTINTGLPYVVENLIVMGFSVLSVINVLIELYKVK